MTDPDVALPQPLIDRIADNRADPSRLVPRHQPASNSGDEEEIESD